MPYWPSYSEIGPTQRRSYLEWLASGRSDPDIGIGYVFLFFYGLERRLFFDREGAEAQELIGEVRRLLSSYPDNRSFQHYAGRFIEAAEVLHGEADVFHIEPELRLSDGHEMPLQVRLYLGRCIGRGTPLTEGEALVWALSHPEIDLKTPGRRCFEELRELWKHRFAVQFPKGLSIQKPKKTIRIEYEPASRTFNCDLAVGDGIPDVLALKARANRLGDLLAACEDQLASYSRLLGRKPEARGTPEAAALLPREIMQASGGEQLKQIATQLEEQFSKKDHVVMTVTNFLQGLQIEKPAKGKLSAGIANQFAAVLDRLDIGYEPDRRYGASTPSIDGRIILFKASGGGPIDSETLVFRTARTMVEIGALAGASDGVSVGEELESVSKDLDTFPDLSDVERTRLKALAVVLMRDAPAQATALKKLSSLPDSEKKKVTQSAISAVLADGQVTPAEVKFIEKLHKSLGYSLDNVYASLHRGAVVIDEPVSVAPAEPTAGIPILRPSDEKEKSAVVAIDQERLTRIQNETQAVSSLLSDIFADDIPEDTVLIKDPQASLEVDERFQGLDEAHAALLQFMVRYRTVDRATFESKAKSLKLLPDGAIETINDWAFDQFDEPILEADDGVYIPEHLHEEFASLEEAV